MSDSVCLHLMRRWRLLSIALPAMAGAGCQSPNLSPPDNLPVFRIEVEDGEEIALIRQRLPIRPLRTEGRVLYFSDPDDTATRLAALGYRPDKVTAVGAYFSTVRVWKTTSEEALQARGLTLLLRDRFSWVVRGSLEQLQALARDGFVLSALGDEPRPRLAVVRLDGAAQRAALIAQDVDVIDAVGNPARGFVVVVRGFEFEFDRLRAAGLEPEAVR